MILYIFLCAMVIRLVSLYVSHANEKRLREGGAKEYGRANTIALTLAHVVFYLSAIKESIYFNRHINLFTYVGIILFIIAMLTLVLIMLKLGKDWTVKIILPINKSIEQTLFYRTIRRSNYFLTVIPELIAITMICQSWYVLKIGLPCYMILLFTRVVQEEKLMKKVIQQKR